MPEKPALPQAHGLRIRVANLDQNGVPTVGVDQLYVSDAFTQVSIDPVYADGAEIDVKNAQGVTAINYKANDTLRRADIEIGLVSVDPFLMSMLGGGSVLSTVNPTRTGFASPRLGEVSSDGVSIEVWTRRIDDGEEDVDYPWGWWVYPRVKNLRQGSWVHEDGAILPAFTGQCYENPNWFDGPLNDWVPTSTSFQNYFPTAQLPAAQVGFFDIAAS